MANSSQNTAQQQQSQSQSAPWQPTQASLQQLISQLQGQSTAPTAAQNSAISALGNAGAGLTAANLGGQAQGAANNVGALPSWLTGLFGNMQSNLSPLTDPNNLNPMNTPGFSNALNYQNQQLTNQINGQFAAAGRDLSPANTQALGYGLGGADAAAIAQQYNANVNNALNANNSVFNAGSNTANLGLNANTGLTNILGQIPGLATAGPTTQLQAAQTAFGLPFSNIGTAESAILPIAGLGGQTSGSASGNSNTTYNPSVLSDIASVLKMLPAGAGLASGILGGLSSLGPASPAPNSYYSGTGF